MCKCDCCPCMVEKGEINYEFVPVCSFYFVIFIVTERRYYQAGGYRGRLFLYLNGSPLFTVKRFIAVRLWALLS